MMNDMNENVVFGIKIAAVVICLSLIGVLIAYLAGAFKKHTKENNSKIIPIIQAWSSDRKQQLYNLLMADAIQSKDPVSKALSTPQIMNCLVNNIASKYNYSDIIVDGKLSNNLPESMELYHGCLGIKGKWNPVYKAAIHDTMMDGTLSDKCVTCMVNSFEQDFAPEDYEKMADENEVQKVMKSCPDCTQK